MDYPATDFVGHALRPFQDDWIVRYLTDIDFYKFTMGQFIWKNFNGHMVTFKLFNRTSSVRLAEEVDIKELEKQIDHVRALSLTRSEASWLRGMDVYGKNMFSNDYLEFLNQERLLNQCDIKIIVTNDGQLEITVTGRWEVVTYWETILLAIVSELRARKTLRLLDAWQVEYAYASAKSHLIKKLMCLSECEGLTFADFSPRRRHSFRWQRWGIATAAEIMGPRFVGTSNTLMANIHNLMPIGTNAHELPMGAVARKEHSDDMRWEQYRILQLWEDMYEQGLRICLPDTFGTKQFLDGAPSWLAAWRGFRQDSGDPKEIGELYLDFFQKHRVDPIETGKLAIFSDGLDVGPILDLKRHFDGRIATTFGWGTKFGNDFPVDGIPALASLRPISIVCKMMEIDSRKTVKLSDNTEKATGEDKREIQRYIEVFNPGERRSFAVEV